MVVFLCNLPIKIKYNSVPYELMMNKKKKKIEIV